ncbi:MAG: PAS domain-containing protein [Hydrogenophaga sp.]|uniref:sensor histidine kinase n=1 Tax=Hydrogenophaga sp. TaxID=1904254 RepID=UPI001D579893|nr:ATP-binding protein [Hydrogenophaga sp.]MBX3609632.1 PAS domain-containing protein [Hydrogenophaga sp.]
MDSTARPTIDAAHWLAFFNAMPGALAVTRRADGRLLAVSDGWCDMLGIAREDALGRTTVELGVWDDNADRQSFLARLAEPGRIHVLRKGKPGQRHARFHSTVLPLMGEEWLLVNIVDAEAEAQTLARLAEQNSLLQRIASRVPGIMYLARVTPDNRSTFVFISEVARQMLQLRPDERTDDARALFARVHPQDLPVLQASLREAAAHEGQVWRFSFRVCLPDGQQRWHQVDAIPVHEPSGSVLWYGFTSDATEQREAQAEIEALNASLERRVTERTADLEQTLRDLEAMAYSMAHDLRTPLRSINGFAALVRDHERHQLSPAGQQAVDRIVGASARMGHMLTGLLEWTQVVRCNLHPCTIDMAALVHETAVMLGLPDAGVTCHVHDLPDAYGDPTLLRQAMQHLLDNAVKFSRGAAHPTIHVDHDTATGAYRIRDNGMGFDPALAQQMFLPFQRVHTDPTLPGLGMGLAIVSRIVQRHGGSVRATCEPGEGSIFWLNLGNLPVPQD